MSDISRSLLNLRLVSVNGKESVPNHGVQICVSVQTTVVIGDAAGLATSSETTVTISGGSHAIIPVRYDADDPASCKVSPIICPSGFFG